MNTYLYHKVLNESHSIFLNNTNITDITANNCNFTDDIINIPTFHESLTCEEIEFQRTYIAENRTVSRNMAIARGTTSILSILSSSTIIWMILRSHDRLSTPYHRLLLGMCVSDILFSSTYATFNFTLPVEDDYWIWNARGNYSTCNMEGFVNIFGLFCGWYYVCSKCFYHVLVIKYQKRNEEIKRIYEPYLHGIPIVLPLIYSTSMLILDAFGSSSTGNCEFSYSDWDRPHCIGYDVGDIPNGFTTPCFRNGFEDERSGSIIEPIFILSFIGVFILVIVCMLMTFLVVKKQESAIRQYGRASIIAAINNANRENQDRGLKLWLQKAKKFLISIATCEWKCQTQEQHSLHRTRSSRNRSPSRAIFHRGLAYSMAFLLTWLPLVVVNITDVWTPGTEYLVDCTITLQGFYNLIIFIYPRIQAAKRSIRTNNPATWWQILVTALKSRGDEPSRRRVGGRPYATHRPSRTTRLHRTRNSTSTRSSTSTVSRLLNRSSRREPELRIDNHVTDSENQEQISTGDVPGIEEDPSPSQKDINNDNNHDEKDEMNNDNNDDIDKTNHKNNNNELEHDALLPIHENGEN